MQTIDFTSIFHESGFVLERSSYNRNGNREGSTRTKDDIKRGVKNSDPRDVRRGADDISRRRNISHSPDGEKRVKEYDKVANDGFNKSAQQYHKVESRNVKGSQKEVNARRNMDSHEKMTDDFKATEKFAKHKAKHESALMDFDMI